MSISSKTIQKPGQRLMVYALIFVFVFQFTYIPALAEDPAGGDTIIVTGDANVGLGTSNDVNQNNTNVTSDSSGDTTGDSDGQSDPGSNSEDTTIVDNTNTGEVDNSSTGSGNTGDNDINTDGSGTTTGDSIIVTGDASIGSGIDNDVNGNNTVVDCPDCENSTTTITVDNTNRASTSNGVELMGNTGDNEINDTGGDAIISTGDIGIINVIINFINHNIFGQGSEFFINIWNSVVETIDLSGWNGNGETVDENIGACEVNNCLVSINNTNTGEIVNEVIIDADTGTNAIANTVGQSIIETGDINIANDVLNIANLNITGNDWFFAVVNIFGELEGNILLPAFEGRAEDRAESLSERIEDMAERTSEVIITNTNNANVLNNVAINANTGENDIASSGEAVIETGNANVRSRAFNLVNYNIFGNSWKFARVNIFGSWEGFIEGLPAGYSYREDDIGITIYSDILDDPALNEQFALLLLDNDNTATATNDITINANTGENSIMHGEGGALIDTGNINIYNSLLNFINSNFTGDNWQFSMVNVFGDWQGNLAFGAPELWITSSIVAPGGEGNQGDYVTISFLFGNNGDAPATNVWLSDIFDPEIFVPHIANGANTTSNGMSLSLGDLPPNSQGSASYSVQVRGDIPYGDYNTENVSTVGSSEQDRDYSNNTTSASLRITRETSNKPDFQTAAESNSSGSGGLSSLSVVKTNNADTVVEPGGIVDYQIIIRNNGAAAAEEVLVLDVMTDLLGEEEINRSMWDLETVNNGEEIVIDYQLEITNNIKSGTYINQVMVEGYDAVLGKYYTAMASSKIKVNNDNYSASPYSPNLGISKVMSTQYGNPGGQVDVELIITNNGQAVAKDVQVSESLPAGLTFSGEDGKTFRKWDLDLNQLNPGQFENINFTIEISADAALGIYTMKTSAWAENIDATTINTDLEVREVAVLGAAGEGGEESATGKLAIGQAGAKGKFNLGNLINATPGITEIKKEVKKLLGPLVDEVELSSREAFAASADETGGTVQLALYRFANLIIILIIAVLIILGFVFRREFRKKINM